MIEDHGFTSGSNRIDQAQNAASVDDRYTAETETIARVNRYGAGEVSLLKTLIGRAAPRKGEVAMLACILQLHATLGGW